MSRQYEMKRRAESRDGTRRRIVEAAIELHQTVGPAATTVTEIAERAKVGRVTFYRHFADVDQLARACSGLYFEQNPAPNPDSWLLVEDPDERLRTAVRETYAYHRATENMISHVLADARDHEVMTPYHELWRHACDVLMKGRRARGRNRAGLRAALAVALSFDTWRTLVREQGLSEAEAVAVAVRMATPSPPAA
jgi:AcrR family transcriptional regulator